MNPAELHWHEDQFQHIVEMAPYAIVLVNDRGLIEVANKQVSTIFGYARNELVHHPLLKLLPERFHELHKTQQRDFLLTEQTRMISEHSALVGRHKNGHEIPLEIGLNLIHTEDGKKVIASIIDVSERLLQQKKLQESSELRQAILDSANFSIICTNTEGLIQTFNKTAERLLGYAEKEIVGIHTPELFHDASEVIERSQALTNELGVSVQPGFETFIAKARYQHMPDEHEWTYIHRDGSRIPILLSVTSIINKEGDISGYLGIGVDLREKKWHESRQHDNEELFRVLYESSGDAHMVTFPEQGFIGANAATAQLFGCSSIEQFTTLSPAAVSPLCQPDGRSSFEKAQEMMAIAMNNGSHQFEWLHQRLDGTLFDADVLLVRMHIGGRALLKATVRDITERNRVERTKNEFISTVSHELRTPLTSITGALSLLEQGVLGSVPDQAIPMVQIALKNSLRLTTLINDLLDLEKLAAAQMVFDMRYHDLMPLIELAVESITSYTAQYKVTCNIIESVETMVRVDDGRLIQVLVNFLSNAAKFSHSGGQIDIAVRKHHYMEHSNVRIEVIDHGEGIPDEFRERIFHKFSQADASDTKNRGGTGLGLAISKELIERMDGLIGFESELGKGSCFYVELPLL